MDILINEQNQEWLRQQVESGKYGSIDEVMEKALRLLEEHDQALIEELTSLQAQVKKSTEQADNGQLTPAG